MTATQVQGYDEAFLPPDYCRTIEQTDASLSLHHGDLIVLPNPERYSVLQMMRPIVRSTHMEIWKRTSLLRFLAPM